MRGRYLYKDRRNGNTAWAEDRTVAYFVLRDRCLREHETPPQYIDIVLAEN